MSEDRKVNRNVLLSPLLAAMLGVAGTAGAFESERGAEDQLPATQITEGNVQQPLDLMVDYVNAAENIGLNDAVADVKCTLYSNSGGTIKCTMYSTRGGSAGDYGDGTFIV